LDGSELVEAARGVIEERRRWRRRRRRGGKRRGGQRSAMGNSTCHITLFAHVMSLSLLHREQRAARLAFLLSKERERQSHSTPFHNAMRKRTTANDHTCIPLSNSHGARWGTQVLTLSA
jgi:hypothetical protein